MAERLERTEVAQKGHDKNCASLDPVKPGELYMDNLTGNLRDEVQQEGLANVFPDEANFVLEVLKNRVEQNAYDQDLADQILLSYVQRYCV